MDASVRTALESIALVALAVAIAAAYLKAASRIGIALRRRNGRPAPPRFTLHQLEGVLVRRGITHEAAVEDPDGYDGGQTIEAIRLAYEDLTKTNSNQDT